MSRFDTVNNAAEQQRESQENTYLPTPLYLICQHNMDMSTNYLVEILSAYRAYAPREDHRSYQPFYHWLQDFKGELQCLGYSV